MVNFYNVTLDKFKTYSLLIEQKSFASATKISGRAYSSLINDIHSLERGLEIKLYMPTKKIFIPTQEGLEALKLAIEMMNRFDVLSKPEFKTSEPVHLKIQLSPSGQILFSQRISEYMKKNSHVRIEMRTEKFDELSNFNFDFDVFIGNISERAVLSKRLLFNSEFFLYADKNYWGDQSVSSIDEVIDMNFLCYNGLTDLPQNIIKNNKVIFSSDSYVTLTQMCVAGLGIASLPKEIVSLYRAENLIKILPNFVIESYGVYFYHQRITNKQNEIIELYEFLSGEK